MCSIAVPPSEPVKTSPATATCFYALLRCRKNSWLPVAPVTAEGAIAIRARPHSAAASHHAPPSLIFPVPAQGVTLRVVLTTKPSWLDISNEQFLTPGFTPLSGTITASGNALLRAGAENPNWGHPMGAVQIENQARI